MSGAVANVAVRFVAEVSGRALPLVLMPLILRSLGPAGYGVQVQVDTVRNLAAPIAVLGLGLALVRQTSGTVEPREVSRVFSTAILSSLCVSSMIAALLAGQAGRVNAALINVSGAEQIIGLGAALIPLAAVESLLNDFCRARLRIVDYSLVQIGATLLLVPGAFLLLNGGKGLVELLSLMLAVKLVAVSVLAVRLWAIGEWLPAAGLLPRRRWVGLLREGLPVIAMALLSWAATLGDRVYIGWLRTAADLGVYAAATNVAVVLVMLAAPFWGPMYPLLAGHLRADESEAATAVCRRFTSAYALLALPALAGVVLVGPQAMALLTGGQAQLPWSMLLILGIGILIDQLAAGAYYLLFARGDSRLVASAYAVACLIGATGNLLLLPRIGIMGAAVTMLAAWLVQSVLLWTMASRAGFGPARMLPLSAMGRYLAGTAIMVVVMLRYCDIATPGLRATLTNVGVGITAYGVALLLLVKGRPRRLLDPLRV